MKRRLHCLLLIVFVIVCPAVYAQSSHWIFHPSADLHSFGVFHFRRQFTLTSLPRQFIVRVSGDNRYQLFVNGRRMVVGPARSDVAHWSYETLDLAPALKKGKNIIAAVVWNQGKYMAWAQMSYQSGFWIEGMDAVASVINSDTSWKVMENKAYLPPGEKWPITGPSENIQAADYPWGWQDQQFDDHTWLPARITESTVMTDPTPPSETQTNAGAVRRLVARNIPFPEEKLQRFKRIRRSAGAAIKNDLINGTGSWLIPANDSAAVILDQDVLTTAFPELWFSGGKGATVTITYAEAPVDSTNGNKGDRNVIAGKLIKGDKDIFSPDGGPHRLFRPLWYRTFRYVELKITTAGEPLHIDDLYSVFTAYPFKEKATFEASDPSLKKIWETGWRTATLCSYETYMDCPYYEQLQYIGDTRIQALISLAVTGDDRLMRNAIGQFSHSFSPEGLTHSRYPESRHQIIPPFSLFWIAMLNDYWRYRPDTIFLRQYLDGVRKVLDWHARYIDSTGMLSHLPYWNFVDWPKEWPWKGTENNSGIPEGTLDGHSSILTLQYVYGLQKAIELFAFFHLDKDAIYYRKIAGRMMDATFKSCWDTSRQLLANTPEKKEFSQHANVMGVLTGLFPADRERELIRRVAFDTTLIQCTYYYRFYLNQAMKKAGWGDEYLSMLQPWKEMIRLGLTTFAERPEPTRSDCHAWSASPCYDLLATIAGIEPATPGFSTVRISPHPGALQWIKGSMPVPAGEIQFALTRMEATGLKGEIVLPPGLSGTFVWGGKIIALHEGRQEIIVKGEY
jgi:alpha-L-rhamnosidase